VCVVEGLVLCVHWRVRCGVCSGRSGVVCVVVVPVLCVVECPVLCV
jgi:hypothetical protein